MTLEKYVELQYFELHFDQITPVTIPDMVSSKALFALFNRTVAKDFMDTSLQVADQE